MHLSKCLTAIRKGLTIDLLVEALSCETERARFVEAFQCQSDDLRT